MFAIGVFGIGFRTRFLIVTYVGGDDTRCEGRDDGEVSDRTGDEFATSYGGSGLSDDRLWVKNCFKGQADVVKL